MVLGKRKRVSRSRAVATSMRVGNWASLARASRARKNRRGALKMQRLSSQVQRITRMIETKHGQWTSANDIKLPHNNVLVVTKDDGGVLNPFQCSQGVVDPMSKDNFQRIGDKISIRGLLVKGFFEGALGRSKVYFRVMLIRGAKGETFNRANLFKNMSDNKMLDQLNTERFSVVWQKIFTVMPPNAAPTGVVPPLQAGAGQTTGSVTGVTGNRIIKAWIPGRKFGRDGVITYEDGSQTQVKFYDYRFVIVAYDWYGTPQDSNNVGVINEMYSCVYFKDA